MEGGDWPLVLPALRGFLLRVLRLRIQLVLLLLGMLLLVGLHLRLAAVGLLLGLVLLRRLPVLLVLVVLGLLLLVVVEVLQVQRRGGSGLLRLLRVEGLDPRAAVGAAEARGLGREVHAHAPQGGNEVLLELACALLLLTLPLLP